MRKFESSLGVDLSGVRVHTGEASATAADAVGARAYTVGQDIHFGAGQYDPHGSGQHLLAHEVAHTVQQQGVTPTRQNKLAVSSPFDAAEHEADRAADAMIASRVATVTSSSGVARKIYRDPQPASAPAPAPADPNAANPTPAPAQATPAPAPATPAPAPAAPPANAAPANANANANANAVPTPVPTAAGATPGSPSDPNSSQFLRPTPTPLDPSVASDVGAMNAGRKAFGQSNDWKDGIDWPGFSAWVAKVPQIEAQIESTINPKIGSDQAVVQHIHDDYQQRITEAFARERAQIEQIVKTDTTVMGYATHIDTQTKLIKSQMDAKSAAMNRIDSSTNEMNAAVAASEQRKAEADKDKEQAYLTKVQAAKTKAIADLEQLPELITGAVKIVSGVVKEGPAALAEPGQKLAETLIMSAYKSWVDKDVEEKFAVTINNVQFKIRNIEARIKNLKDAEFADRVVAANANARAAASELQAANTAIGAYADDINRTRVQLGIYILQKYKDVTVFRLASEAQNAMKPALTKYLTDLGAAKAQIKLLEPWQQYFLQLVAAESKAAGTSWLNDGTAPQLGDRAPPSKEDQAKIMLQVAQVERFKNDVGNVGKYVESETAHYDAEIEKAQSGGYLDFIQNLDQQVLAMLPTAVPVAVPGAR